MAMVQSKWTDTEILALWEQGDNQIEIARHTGLSRERIRQRLARHGIDGKNANAVPKAEVFLRSAGHEATVEDLSRALGISTAAAVKAMKAYGIRADIDSLLAVNKKIEADAHRAHRQSLLVTQLRTLALQVGRTPTSHDMELIDIFPMTIHSAFGSVAAGMEAAGLAPNVAGNKPRPLPAGFRESMEGTADEAEFVRRVNDARRNRNNSAAPSGTSQPLQVVYESMRFVRSPAVTAWLLNIASGLCECCGEAGYETDDGTRFLEVHHVVPLAESGPDTVDNTVTVCEICHGNLHRWIKRDALTEMLYSRVARLRR